MRPPTLHVSYTPSLAHAVRAVCLSRRSRWQIDTSEYFRQIGRNPHAGQWAALLLRASQLGTR